MASFQHQNGACACSRDKCSYDCVTYSRYNPKPLTNADRIRSMSDEELAEWMCQMQARDGELCPPKHGYKLCLTENGCKPCWLEWLKKEAQT